MLEELIKIYITYKWGKQSLLLVVRVHSDCISVDTDPSSYLRLAENEQGELIIQLSDELVYFYEDLIGALIHGGDIVCPEHVVKELTSVLKTAHDKIQAGETYDPDAYEKLEL